MRVKWICIKPCRPTERLVFEGPFMMDHTPSFPQENAQWAGRAFAVGYIRSMIQAVYR